MFKWLHHLLNPHCPDCLVAAQEAKVCESCETVKAQLAIVNIEKRQMLETILALTKPGEVQVSNQVEQREVAPRALTWNVRRQMLEAEDRVKAQVIAKQKKEWIERKATEEIGHDVTAGSASEFSPPKAVEKPFPIDNRAQSIEELEKELGINQEATSA